MIFNIVFNWCLGREGMVGMEEDKLFGVQAGS